MLTPLHYLRAVAALMVVAFHALELFNLPGEPHQILASGVDVFFVLSGFLMVHTTQKYSAGRLDFHAFMRNRILRVGPIYWLITGLVGLAVLVKPGLTDRPIDSWVVAKSMAFLPSRLGDNNIQTTVLPVGWSLVYEMSFYLAFAALAAWSYRLGVAALIALLVALSASNGLVTNFYASHYTNPIMLEFAIGMLVALWAPRSPENISRGWWLSLVAIGFTWTLLGAWLDGVDMTHRWLTCGVGAAITLLAAVNLKLPELGVAMLLGDASYSIYLTHLYGMKYLAHKFFPGLGWVGGFAVGIVVGVVFHLLVERPLAIRLRPVSR